MIIEEDNCGNTLFFCCANIKKLYTDKKIKFYSNYTSYNPIFSKIKGLFGTWVYSEKDIDYNDEDNYTMEWHFCPFCYAHFYNDIDTRNEIETITKAFNHSLSSFFYACNSIFKTTLINLDAKTEYWNRCPKCNSRQIQLSKEKNEWKCYGCKFVWASTLSEEKVNEIIKSEKIEKKDEEKLNEEAEIDRRIKLNCMSCGGEVLIDEDIIYDPDGVCCKNCEDKSKIKKATIYICPQCNITISDKEDEWISSFNRCPNCNKSIMKARDPNILSIFRDNNGKTALRLGNVLYSHGFFFKYAEEYNFDATTNTLNVKIDMDRIKEDILSNLDKKCYIQNVIVPIIEVEPKK